MRYSGICSWEEGLSNEDIKPRIPKKVHAFDDVKIKIHCMKKNHKRVSDQQQTEKKRCAMHGMKADFSNM